MAKRLVFVSHSHADGDFCRQFVDQLRKKGLDVWYDEDDLELGRTLGQRIAPELYRRPIFILILSRQSLRSPYVFAEFEVALYYQMYEKAGPGPRLIIPVVIEKLQIQDFSPEWGFIHPIPRIEAQGDTPLPLQEIVKKLIDNINKGEMTTSSPATSVDLYLPALASPPPMNEQPGLLSTFFRNYSAVNEV